MERHDSHSTTHEYPHPFIHAVTLTRIQRIRVTFELKSPNLISWLIWSVEGGGYTGSNSQTFYFNSETGCDRDALKGLYLELIGQ